MKLEQFLVLAKKNTYASGAEEIVTVLPDGSKELIFQAESFRYRDRYFGAEHFIGQEVVWQNETILWGMNYYGFVYPNTFLISQFNPFLRKALRQVSEERPYRGPNYLKEGDLEYFDESQGLLEHFTGVEKIFYLGREIYRLEYHGGMISK